MIRDSFVLQLKKKGTHMSTLKIKTINIDNFKGISNLHKDIDGNVIYVSGRNGAGKSTVLDAIYAAISKTRMPEKPIKEGEKKATINLTLAGQDAELDITRTITPKSNTLTVTENGKKVKDARTLLDGLLSSISIDPFKFMSLSDKEQSELMTKACGIEFDFEQFEDQLQDNIEGRKQLKREIKSLEGSIESIDVPEDLEGNDYDVVELNKKLNKAIQNNIEVEKQQKDVKEARERAIRLKKEYMACKEIVEKGVEGEIIDTLELETQIRGANEHQELASKIAMKKQYEEQLSNKKGALKTQEAGIKELEKTKEDALKDFKSPVEGLTTDGSKLYLGDAPYSQASSAERIEVAAKLSMLASKDVKVINIKDASLLDDEMVGKITEVAKENDCQVFMEMVSNESDVCLTFEEDATPLTATEVKASNEKIDKAEAEFKEAVEATNDEGEIEASVVEEIEDELNAILDKADEDNARIEAEEADLFGAEEEVDDEFGLEDLGL